MDMEGGISVGKNSIYKGTDIETKRPELRRAFMTGAMSSLHSLMTELSHHQAGELTKSGLPGLLILEGVMLY